MVSVGIVPELPELLPVPTVSALVRKGLADTISTDKNGNVTVARVGAKGHELMGKAMIENGRRLRAHQESTPREPVPTTGTPATLPPDDPWPVWE